jgi:hypothetical protein
MLSDKTFKDKALNFMFFLLLVIGVVFILLATKAGRVQACSGADCFPLSGASASETFA